MAKANKIELLEVCEEIARQNPQNMQIFTLPRNIRENNNVLHALVGDNKMLSFSKHLAKQYPRLALQAEPYRELTALEYALRATNSLELLQTLLDAVKGKDANYYLRLKASDFLAVNENLSPAAKDQIQGLIDNEYLQQLQLARVRV